MKLTLNFVTPKEHVAKDLEVTQVVAPAFKGEVTILPGHTPFLSVLEKGRVAYKDKNNQGHEHQVSEGFVEVREHGKITILAEIEKEVGKDIPL